MKYHFKTETSNSLLFKILNIIAHILWTFVEKLYDVLRVNYKFLSYFISKYTNSNRNPFQRMLQLKKIPTHLTIILGEENPSYHDLANLVIWSIFVGIPFISFYDHKGRLNENENHFQEVVTKLIKEEDHIIWYNNERNIYKNGFVNRKIHIRILSRNDGRPLILKVTEDILNTSETINIEFVDSLMKKHFVFPDPDLAFIFGRKCTTWGYPPWQVRLTEFLNLRRPANLTPNVFTDLLDRYSICEQRLGR